MSPERRAAELSQVEAKLDEAGCDLKVALDHADADRARAAREKLRSLGRRRLRLRYAR